MRSCGARYPQASEALLQSLLLLVEGDYDEISVAVAVAQSVCPVCQ